MKRPMKEKVQVWIAAKGEVLLLKTRPERAGGYWQPVTGSVEEGEELLAAAIRELGEETGIKGSPETVLPLHYQFEFVPQFGKHKTPVHETCFYITLNEKPARIAMDPKEHTEYRWVNSGGARELLRHESNREALKKFCEILGK